MSSYPSVGRRSKISRSSSCSTSGAGGGGSTSSTIGGAGGPVSTTILALVEGRGQARGEVGMAGIDLNSPHLIITQFTDTLNYTKVIAKINIFHPVEILMPATSCDISGQPSRLFSQIKKEFSSIPIIPVQRRLFHEAKGLQQITNLVCEQFSSVVNLVTQKYYCLASTSALLKYIELARSVVYCPKSLKIEFQGCEKSVMIDSSTAQHLELLHNNSVPNSSQSLLGLINNCRTPGGVRLLRINILQPPCDLTLISTRLDCIEELRNNAEVLYGTIRALSQLPQDIEHVIGTLVQVQRANFDKTLEQRINYIIFLKQALNEIPNLVNALETAEHPFFVSIRDKFTRPIYGRMLEKIQEIINEEAKLTKGTMAMRIQRSFAVKPEINPILDLARTAYCEIYDDLSSYVTTLSEENNLPLKLLESSARGFYLQFIIKGRNWDLPDLPRSFLNIRKQRNIVTFTTEKILLWDQRIREILEEVQNITNMIITELISTIREDIESLYTISDGVAELDVLCSLAHFSISTLNVVRPEFSSDTTGITLGKHPVLDIIKNEITIPNSILMTNDTNVAILTGPNMSGKTTFLKQIATLQVLAQIGSFVPAESATFKLVNRIFSRIGNGDSIEGSASSFALEMTEMNYILKNVNDKSLIIIDELGRSTSIEEGTGISWALIESLLQTKSFTLIATHFLFLTKLESLYSNVLNYRLETVEYEAPGAADSGIGVRGANDSFDSTNENQNEPNVPNPTAGNTTTTKLAYTHVLQRGVTQVEYYGLKLTSCASYPANVLENAKELAKKIMAGRLKAFDDSDEDIPSKKNLYLLACQLFMAARGFHDSSSISRHLISIYMTDLQEEFKIANQLSDSGEIGNNSRVEEEEEEEEEQMVMDVDVEMRSQSQ